MREEQGIALLPAEEGLERCAAILEDVSSYVREMSAQTLAQLLSDSGLYMIQWNCFKRAVTEYIAATHAVQKKMRNRVFQFRQRRLTDADYTIQYTESNSVS